MTYSARPRDVIRELVTLLRGQGLTRVYWSACAMAAVVSVTYGLTVWTDGQMLCCQVAGEEARRWPAWDTVSAAADLATLAGQPSPAAP